jgi:hypothetical protein
MWKSLIYSFLYLDCSNLEICSSLTSKPEFYNSILEILYFKFWSEVCANVFLGLYISDLDYIIKLGLFISKTRNINYFS